MTIEESASTKESRSKSVQEGFRLCSRALIGPLRRIGSRKTKSSSDDFLILILLVSIPLFLMMGLPVALGLREPVEYDHTGAYEIALAFISLSLALLFGIQSQLRLDSKDREELVGSSDENKVR